MLNKSDYSDYRQVSEGKKYVNDSKIIQRYGIGQRHVQVLLLFICYITTNVVNTQLFVTIVAMTTNANPSTHNETIEVNTTNSKLAEDTTDDKLLLNTSIVMIKSEGIFRKYKWSKFEQDLILQSYYIGTVIFIFPASVLVQRFGGKIILQFSYLIASLISIAMPWIALWGGWQAICVCRVALGIVLACLYPSSHTLLGKWIPVSERGRFNSFVFTGTTCGTVLGYQMSGLLAGGRAGWPTIFWMSGALCIVAFVLITMFTANSPSQSNRINEDEIKFIMGEEADIQKKHKTPWKQIATSTHAWATILTHAGTGTAYMFCLIQIPTYINRVLRVNVTNSGLLSSLPHIAKFFCGIGFGYLSDICINKKLISIKNARRISNTVGNIGMAVCLASVTFTDDTTVSIVLFIISMGSCAITYSGWLVNYIDLTPSFSGALISGGNVLGDIIVLALPSIVQHVITDTSNRYQWRVLFLIISTVAFVCNLVFLVFVSADVQPWNDDRYKRNHREIIHKADHLEETDSLK